ncbi:MAG: GAF domain-containing protein [Chloroflexaceae bacterium]|nr:GAF domain-containing protein [Chloroflexaceae bacterium]
MPTFLSPSAETLAVLAEATRMLHEDGPFGRRVHELFKHLHRGMRYGDARLTCWFPSARPGAQRQQFYSSDTLACPWDNQRMRQTAMDRQVVRYTLQPETNAPSPPALARRGGEIIYLGAPICWGKQLWGVLEVRSGNPDDLGTTEQELIAALLPQIAVAIAMEGERQHQGSEPNVQSLPALLPAPPALLAQTALLDALEHELKEPLALHKLLTMLLRWSLDATGAEAGAVFLVDHDHAELVMQVYEGYTPEMFPTDVRSIQRHRWKWNTGLAGRAVQSGRALLVRDVTREVSLQFQTVAANLRAELAVPLCLDQRALAVLVLDSPRSSAFGDEELAFVNALCERATRPLYHAMRYQEIVETSTQLHQVFSSLPTGLALLDTSGRVLRTNPAWSAVWGIAERPAGQPVHVPIDLVDDLLPRLPDPLLLVQFCTDGQNAPREAQMMNIRLMNPARELQVLSVPTHDSLGQVTGRLWMVSDVTREREVDRLKNEFVSIVSHELRTPLTSILGFTELLLVRQFSPSEQRQFIQTVYDQANHLSKLVEDLLSVSRIEAGKVKLHRWIVALRQIIAELTNQIGQLERHRLLIRLVEPMPPVSVDRDKVRQVLFNLVTNAIKYSPAGGEIELAAQEVRVTAIGRDEEEGREGGEPRGPGGALPPDHPVGRWIVVSVRDQGIGIAAEHIPLIWERFYRVDNTNTRRIGGTGLGLSITRSLVELHGGRIWVESEVGQGSVFFFTLPVAADMRREEDWG